MLVELTVTDFALIESLRLTFSPNLNVITGETGAGKSILIGALGTLMGERTGPDVIRAGEDRASIEARFRVPPEHPACAMVRNLGGEIDGDEIIIRRDILADGRARVWVGGSTIPVRALQDIGDRLVDFHGQHDHQLLLRPSAHVELLDAFAGNGERLSTLRRRHETLRTLRGERDDLVSRQKEMEQQRDMIEFERDELEETNPQPGELDSLESERNVLENVERLAELLSGLTHLLSESDDSVASRLGSGRRWLQDAVGIDESLAELSDQYEQTEVYAQEVAARLSDRLASLEADPMRLEQVQERIGRLRRLVRRYGTMEDAIARREELGRVMDDDADMDQRIGEAETRIADEYGRFADATRALSTARNRAALRMSREITESLSELGMERARFEVQLRRESAPGIHPISSDAVEIEDEVWEATSDGAEQVEYMISPNLGEPLRPLARIASGGEISRTMLAIKSVLSGHDPVDTMVFDEIDAGVSGRIAESVGRRMRELSRHRQIIAITHLPQIAASGDEHITVTKREERKRTVTEADVLTGEGRRRALAELIGGAEVTETALEHARTMLEERR